MKNRRMRITKIIGILVLVYFLCVSIGFIASFAISVCRNKASLLAIVQLHAENYVRGANINLIIPGESALIYDKNGLLLLEIDTDGGGLGEGYKKKALRHLPAILPAGLVYSPIFTMGAKPVMLLVGAPLMQGGAAQGAFFLVRPIQGAGLDFLAFWCVFTLVYGIGTVFMLHGVKRTRELEAMRSTYVANISHDLKSPVASIKALTETMADGLVQDEESQRRYFGIMLTEANRLEHAIKDMLELSRLQSYQTDFSKASIPAEQVFYQICEKYDILCEDRDIHFHVSDAIPGLPALYTNTGGMIRILEILLDNALRFVEEGGHIWLEASCHSKQAVICVRDDGKGISPKALPFIFERFFKEESGYASAGNGLGLAIAKEITLALKERIWVKSEAGKGSAFYFTAQVK